MNGFGGEMHHIQDVVCIIRNRWEHSKIVWQQTVGTTLPPKVRAKFAKNCNLHERYGVENNTSKPACFPNLNSAKRQPSDFLLVLFRDELRKTSTRL